MMVDNLGFGSGDWNYIPGFMPAGGYPFGNPNYGNFGSNFIPGNAPAEGTGNPIMPASLPEGSQVLPDWLSPYGANYGTAGYTPPPDPWANDPIGRLYGRSSNPNPNPNLSNPVQLSHEDMVNFLAQPGFQGNSNDPEAVKAYIAKFPAAVQDQMLPGGRLWGQFFSPDWKPSWGGKGVFTSDYNPWARTPQELQAAGQDWMTNRMGNVSPGLQRHFADWFNQNALGGTGLSLTGPPRPPPMDPAMARAMAMAHDAKRHPGPTLWDQIQRNAYNKDVMGGNFYGGVIPQSYNPSLGVSKSVPPGGDPNAPMVNNRLPPTNAPPPDPWTTLAQQGITQTPWGNGPVGQMAPNAWTSLGGSTPWGGTNYNSFGASPWG